VTLLSFVFSCGSLDECGTETIAKIYGDNKIENSVSSGAGRQILVLHDVEKVLLHTCLRESSDTSRPS
jgi:hypothetical protein